MKQYSFSKGLFKGVVAVIIMAVPIFANLYPTWANLTIGGALVMLVNFLKIKYGK